MGNLATGISVAIGKVFDFFKVRTEKQSETFTINSARRMRKAIEAAENYIRRNNKIGRKTDKLLNKYEKTFFKYNN